ncbi:hypothetical protein LADH09A_002165 [Micromonospora sp. LAH09]|uniref:hypothetical protein n=1 Tax=Micromonospora cabrerizensis TaxID=2911213 RepID=UPI001EE955BB|nr:hypothetical protein [Micromonospora cabrerizensis]MCG5468305.1 hypothetical protein [Micromonospora cabrerizensis]
MPTVDLLRAGVTTPRLDPTACATWLASVYGSIRGTGGAVTTSAEEPTVGRNYYRIAVRLTDGTPLYVLLNSAAALVAAARQRDPHLPTLLFADVPGGEIYRRAGLRVATAAELEQPIEDRFLRLLTDEERRDVTYYRPARLGDLLFNWFD